MTLAGLRTRGALRALAARPVWLVAALTLLGALGLGIFRGTRAAVAWLYAYPLVGSIAPAVVQRSLEGLFLMLMAAVLFSVLVASIGTVYGSADLEFLLALPTSSARVFAMKVVELFVNTAGLPLVLTVPALAGVGAALSAHPGYYLVATVAAAALYSLPVTVGALLALALVRFAPAGRVREVATAVSIGAAALALVGLRALRPERLARLDLQDADAFESFLAAFARLDVGWLPPAWATKASWAAIGGEPSAAAAALAGAAVAGLLLTAGAARLAFVRGWVRSVDSPPAPRRRPARPAPAWERALTRALGATGAILAKDARVFVRDVQQWSQAVVLLALAGVYLLSLAAIPVPTQQFRDVVGAFNIAFVSFIVAGVALRVAYPSVAYEAGSYWLVQVQPLRATQLVAAKFLLVLPVMLGFALTLGLAAGRLLDLSPALAFGAPVTAALSALALTGLAVGMGAANPRFEYTNANELALTPGAMAFMAIALAYAALTTLLLARPAWLAVGARAGGYWTSPEGLAVLGVLGVLSLATAALPLWLGARQLAKYEL